MKEDRRMTDVEKKNLKKRIVQAQCVDDWKYRKLYLELQYAMLEEMREITKQLNRIASNV